MWTSTLFHTQRRIILQKDKKMSTTLLYQAFGIREFKCVSTSNKCGITYFKLERKTYQYRCSECSSKRTIKAGQVERSIRLLPVGSRQVFGVFKLQVFRCKDCGATRQETIKGVASRKSYCKRLAALVVQLGASMAISEIALYLKLYWHLVKDIIKENLKLKVKRRKLKHVRIIAIDEVAVKRNHYFMTIVTDLEAGQVIFVAEGKRKQDLKPFFMKLKRAKAHLVACAMDMYSPYRSALNEYYNSRFLLNEDKCKIVIDHFHAVKAMNEALDKIRRQMVNNSEEEGRKILKGSRLLLLMGPGKLAEKPERIFKLKRLLKLNDFLMKAWMLKESFMLIWKQPTREIASQFIDEWMEETIKMGNRQLMTIVKMLERHRENILNYYDFKISTGPLEGLINKIKVIKRVAYGYRDMEFFKLRILTSHNTKYNLSGT